VKDKRKNSDPMLTGSSPAVKYRESKRRNISAQIFVRSEGDDSVVVALPELGINFAAPKSLPAPERTQVN
jgi:hypothetical protein